LRRLDAARGRRRLPAGGLGLGGVGAHVPRRHRVTRKPPLPPTLSQQHHPTYNTTQLTYSAPLNSRTLIEAGYSRFTYGYARFGMAAPDGLMDLIPVTEQSGIYGRKNLYYRGVLDP